MEILSSINALLVNAIGPLGPLVVVGGLGLLLVLLTLPAMLKKRADPLDKLRAANNNSSSSGKPNTQTLRRADKNDKLQKFATFLEPQDAEAMSSARLKMLRAGYRGKNAVRAFHASQFALGIGFLLIGLIYAITKQATGEMSTQMLVISIIGPGAAGYYLPQYWVNKRLKKRQEEITAGFPDALDMMLVCVEAGQSLDQSILRVAKELHAGYPALAEEFDMVGHEVKAGKERISVLKDMSERVGLQDISSFVTVLVQSATFGTSIAEALRVYASEMRDKRVMRAEEKANTLPTKLTLGTMMFTVPPLMIILIGPSIYGIATQLGGGG
ncbi:MAG: pilus assembly protein TadC [Cereibacter sphaeroides]|uniref:Pilus assembly protein TadC n=1 Tax=Cereibacter sphaeroides TaxID=1063 RepID=A0A2W5SIA9_CERSP|nr:MAG: pilus assembly protein TadC [Cereibacter sphaeroides]